MTRFQNKSDAGEVSISGRVAAYRHGCSFSLVPPMPIDMSLDLFGGCNHKCLFCPNRKKEKKLEIMPLPLATSILEQGFQAGVREVGLYGQGEPFLVPDFHLYVRAAKTLGYRYVYVTTNGSLLDAQTLTACLDAGLDSIKFSINAYGPEAYRFVHGRDDFETVIANLDRAIETATKRQVKLFISCVIHHHARGTLNALQQLYYGKVNEIIGYPCSSFNGLSPENIGLLTDKTSPRNSPCHWPFSRVSVTPEGFLSACCGDIQNYLAVDNLRNVSLVEAWHSPKMRQLRQRHLTGRLEGTLCHNCLTDASAPLRPLAPDLASPICEESYFSKARLESLLASRRSAKK